MTPEEIVQVYLGEVFTQELSNKLFIHFLTWGDSEDSKEAAFRIVQEHLLKLTAGDT